MIRLSKLTDYAIVLAGYISERPAETFCTARELGEEAGLPLPTVSKILKTLSRAGLLISHRGNKGGYTLAKPATEISIADIISAVEGPPALTECSSSAPVLCELEDTCPARSNWMKINDAVCEALKQLTLEDMVRPEEGCADSGDTTSLTEPLLKLVRR